MKERPIIFSGPMVRALLGGTKTQTRRIVKPQPTGFVGGPGVSLKDGSPAPLIPLDETVGPCGREIQCPYGKTGDQLWVRETWNWFDPDTIPANRIGNRAPFTGRQGGRDIPWVAAYASDGALPEPGYERGNYWRPSIHMPRWASRITLEITGVRVERLQNISATDALAEGVNVHPDHHGKPATSIYGPIQAYRDLWGQINGANSWDANPWVWVLEFRRVQS